MATTGGGGAGAVRVSGVPPGGVSGAGAAADDVGSVIDFLSGAHDGDAFVLCTLIALRPDQQIYSTRVAPTWLSASGVRFDGSAENGQILGP